MTSSQGVGLKAGDYDCMLSGVYGESDLSSSSADSELIPLIKRLLGLLESGQPFVLSPDLLNVINVTSQPPYLRFLCVSF